MATSTLERPGTPAPASSALFMGRAEAGHLLLAGVRAALAGLPGPRRVLALSTGGVAVAEPIADALGLALELSAVREFRIPLSSLSVVIGATAQHAYRRLEDDGLARLHVSGWIPDHVASVEARKVEPLQDRFRPGSGSDRLQGEDILLVDDGLLSALGLLAAVDSARIRGAERIFVVCPMISDSVMARLVAAGARGIRVGVAGHDRAGVGERLYGSEPPPSSRDTLCALGRAARTVPSGW